MSIPDTASTSRYSGGKKRLDAAAQTGMFNFAFKNFTQPLDPNHSIHHHHPFAAIDGEIKKTRANHLK
jgi:hypothetical protein